MTWRERVSSGVLLLLLREQRGKGKEGREGGRVCESVGRGYSCEQGKKKEGEKKLRFF